MSLRLRYACHWFLAVLVAVFAAWPAHAEVKHQGHPKAPAAHGASRPHGKPAVHAKVAKKKRPTVPQKKKAVAKRPKASLKASKHPQSGPKVLPKPNHETLTPVLKVPPTASNTPGFNASPSSFDSSPAEEKPKHELVSPEPPKAPDVPQVQGPKPPTAPNSAAAPAAPAAPAPASEAAPAPAT